MADVVEPSPKKPRLDETSDSTQESAVAQEVKEAGDSKPKPEVENTPPVPSEGSNEANSQTVKGEVAVTSNKPEKVRSGTLTESQRDSLKKIIDDEDIDSQVVIPLGADPDKRLLVHAAIRTQFPKLQTATSVIDGKKVIIARKPRPRAPANNGNQPEEEKSAPTQESSMREGDSKAVEEDPTPAEPSPDRDEVVPVVEDSVPRPVPDSKPVSEVDVGITEFISTHDGFQGIIKQRYSDFMVREISLDNQIVALTSRSLPEDDTIKKDDGSGDDILTESQRESLQKLLDDGDSGSQCVIPVGNDKNQRSLIHAAIRKLAPDLESATSVIDGEKVIIARRPPGTSGKKGGKNAPRRAERWPHPGRDYCHFCLYKENVDTMEAVNILTSYLHIKPNVLTYAGTKDKRAKTCQLGSVYRLTASRLIALNKVLKGMTLGNFSYNKSPIRLGDLKGNHFTIVLRCVTGSDEQISQGVQSLKSVGFINYFGMQRFGTTSVPTHFIGRALLKSNWQEAIELILQPRGDDAASDNNISRARLDWWQHRDAARALDVVCRRSCPEKFLLSGLKARTDTDLVGALGYIPRNQRTMYIHAYQSYVWNLLVSRRLRQHGLQPITGDLIIKKESLWQPQRDDESGERRTFTAPTVLTESDLASVTIHDVVFPLPGYDVVLPENDTAQWIHDTLAADGFSISDLKHRVKDYALRGQYRHIVVRPQDLSYETVNYSDPMDPLVLSDLDKINGVQLKVAEEGAEHKAINLSFSLPSSTYATMALREVLKQDTSAAFQTKLTKAIRTDPKPVRSNTRKPKPEAAETVTSDTAASSTSMEAVESNSTAATSAEPESITMSSNQNDS